MRYLITCDFALTFVGGAQNAMIRQAEALHAQGDHVLVVAANASKINFSKGIQVIEPPKTATLPNIDLPVFRNNAKLRRFARETIETFKADAVLSHSEFSLVAALTDVARELACQRCTPFTRSSGTPPVTPPC